MAQTPPLSVPLTSTSAVPIRIRIGSAQVHLGDLVLAHARGGRDLPAQLANLLRAAADALTGGHPDGWPRQRWYPSDHVQLPGSVAHGTVVQVDTRAKTYRVDVGAVAGPVTVSWSDVDQPGVELCNCSPDLAAAVARAYPPS